MFDINGGIKSLEMALTHLSPTPTPEGEWKDGMQGAVTYEYGKYGKLWVGEDKQQIAAEVRSRKALMMLLMISYPCTQQ